MYLSNPYHIFFGLAMLHSSLPDVRDGRFPFTPDFPSHDTEHVLYDLMAEAMVKVERVSSTPGTYASHKFQRRKDGPRIYKPPIPDTLMDGQRFPVQV